MAEKEKLDDQYQLSIPLSCFKTNEARNYVIIYELLASSYYLQWKHTRDPIIIKYPGFVAIPTHQPATVTDLICRIGHEGKNVELFMVLAWFIWCWRNKFHFKEPSLPPDKLLEAASNSLVEFQTKQTDRPTQHKPTIQNWRPPQKDTYKINYDSAVFSESDEAGIGVVVRNERGEVMASLARRSLCHR